MSRELAWQERKRAAEASGGTHRMIVTTTCDLCGAGTMTTIPACADAARGQTEEKRAREMSGFYIVTPPKIKLQELLQPGGSKPLHPSGPPRRDACDWVMAK